MNLTLPVTDSMAVDFERGEITLHVDEYELIREMGGADEILQLLDYEDVVRFVAEAERDKREEEV